MSISIFNVADLDRNVELQEDDELDDEEDDMIDFAEIAFRVMEHKETLAAAARAGGVAGSVAKRPQAPRGMGLGAGRAGNSTLSSPRGGLAGSETIRAQKVAKVIARFRKELNAYKLGTLYAMKSLPPHEVFKNILTKPPENRLEVQFNFDMLIVRFLFEFTFCFVSGGAARVAGGDSQQQIFPVILHSRH
jgi:hypothetical protein